MTVDEPHAPDLRWSVPRPGLICSRAEHRRRCRHVRYERFKSGRVSPPFDREGVLLPLTHTQLATAIADRAEISRTEAKRVLVALEEIVREEFGNAEKVRVGGLVQLTVRIKRSQKARKGRNPGYRRGDHDRRQARECRPSRATARTRQSLAAIGAEGPPMTRRLTPASAPVADTQNPHFQAGQSARSGLPSAGVRIHPNKTPEFEKLEHSGRQGMRDCRS